MRTSNDNDYLGNSLLRLNELDQAKCYIEKALMIKEQESFDLNRDVNYAKMLQNMGNSLSKLNNFSQAQTYFDNSLKIMQKALSDFNSNIFFC